MNKIDIDKIREEFVRLSQPDIKISTEWDRTTLRLVLGFRPKLIGLIEISDALPEDDKYPAIIAKLLYGNICNAFEEAQRHSRFCHRWYFRFLMRIFPIKD